MNLRALIKDFQEGLVKESDDHLLPQKTILRANSAGELLEFLKNSETSERKSFVGECVKLAYPYSHLRDKLSCQDVVAKVLSGGPTIVISHQPTFFSYSGVYVQFILAGYLAKEIKKVYGVDAAIIYLCLDTDDACDRRIKTAHFPFPGSRDGSITISYALGNRYKNVPQFCVPFQDDGYRNAWKEGINSRFGLVFSLLPEMRHELQAAQKNIANYLDYLWDQTSTLQPTSFADFSLSILMRFVNDIVESPVIPIRSSDLFTLGRDTILNLLINWEKIVETGRELLNKYNLSKDSIFSLGPAWIICKTCNFRNSTSHETTIRALSREKTKLECSKCGKSLQQIDGDFVVMPKVILEDLSAVELTGANLTLTYAGSTQHVVLSNSIRQVLFGRESSIYTWHPKHFLASTLDKAALKLIQKSNKIESAIQALKLASEGRDTLLFLTQFSKISDLSTDWVQHFCKRKLSDRMIHNESYELFAMYQQFT